MKKLMLTMGLAAITAIGWSQSDSYTTGACFCNGIFFKVSGEISISDNTVEILGNTYNIVPSTNSTIYITDGVNTGSIVIMNHTTPKRVKGFTPQYDVIHNLDVNSQIGSCIYYVIKNE